MTDGFKQMPFSRNRELVIDVVELGRAKHHISGFFEADVTFARHRIGEYREKTGERLSFTGWVIKCIGQAVQENPQIHAIRKGRKKLIVFDDVDILVTVEKQLGKETIPLPYVIRKVQEKSLPEISGEIHAAQDAEQPDHGMIIGQESRFLRFYSSVPRVIQRAIGRSVIKDPFYIKKSVGTVGVSSVGMMGSFNGWILPVSPQPLYFSLCSIEGKPVAVNGSIEIREKLKIAFLFDHDVIDGAPVARFIGRLTSLIENSFALDKM